MADHKDSEERLDPADESAQVPRRDFLAAGGAMVLGAAVVGAGQTLAGQDAGGLPPEFSASPDDLKPGSHDSDLYMESNGYTAENEKVTSWIGRNTAGIAVGLVQLRAVLPMIPGHVGNGTTFRFPILYREIETADLFKIMALEPEKETRFVEDIVRAAHWLELQGVRAIVGNCGFFGTFQTLVQERIDTPFFSSSLVQLPGILTCLPRRKKVGVITANAPVLRDGPAIRCCGVAEGAKSDRILIEGAEGPEFTKILKQTGEPFNVLKLEREIVAAAERLVKRDPNIGAILLECTELPPAAAAVQNAVRLPVYDYTTLINWIQDGAVRRPFVGYM